jgi:hypothetical protein
MATSALGWRDLAAVPSERGSRRDVGRGPLSARWERGDENGPDWSSNGTR